MTLWKCALDVKMKKKTSRTTLLWLTLLRKPSDKSSNDLTTTTTTIITLNIRNSHNSLHRTATTVIPVVRQEQDVDLYFTVGEVTNDHYLLTHVEFILNSSNNTTILFLPRTITNITITINNSNNLE